MKKTLLIMVMALAVLLTQCRKPEVKFPSPVAPEGTTVSMTVTAGPGSKTDITAAGGITWSTGDKLYVGDGTKYVGYLTLVSGADTPTGTFSGDVTLTGISEGTEKEFGFFYLGNAKDYSAELEKGTSATVEVSFATQTGLRENLGSCHVGYGSANGTVTNGIVTGINVTLVSKVALARFSFTESDSKGAYTGALMLGGEHIYNKMTVSFDSSEGFAFTPAQGYIRLTNTTSSEKYVMLVPTGSTEAETLNFVVDVVGKTTLENGIESNKFYGRDGAIEVTVKHVEFSVGSGTTVTFSPGNLQYLGKSDGSGTWRFADHQWDILGAGPSARSNKGNVDLSSLGYTAEQYNYGSGEPGGSETSDDKASARDLFGWGTTGYKDTRDSTYQTNYQPYSTSKTAAASGTDAYTYNRYGYGPDYDANKYGLTVAAKSDWGCVTGLPSAGEGKTWRTLSMNEWDYLLNINGSSGRTDANRFAKAKVNGVRGLLIFPDGYTLPDGYTTDDGGTGMAKVNKATSSLAPWPTADIPTDTWTSMETAGVVFLPAAGQRTLELEFSDVGKRGNYWTNATDYPESARYMYFYSASIAVTGRWARATPLSVRLVRSV